MCFLIPGHISALQLVTDYSTVCLCLCLMVLRPRRGSTQSICPRTCQYVYLSVWLSAGISIFLCVIHDFIKLWKRVAGRRTWTQHKG